MIEPTVLDYIRAAAQLDRERFCKQFRWPILITSGAQLGHAFQADPTQVTTKPPNPEEAKGLAFTKEDPVLTLMSDRKVDDTEIAVGRSEENDVVLHDTAVSGEHAIFRRIEPDLYTLEDLSSTNGTLVNEIELEPGRQAKLQNGDVIQFGDSKFKFFYPGGLYDRLANIRS